MNIRSSFILLAVALVLPATAADVVRIKLGERGLESLTYAGVEYVDPSGAGGLGFTGGGAVLRGAGGADFETTPTATQVDGDTILQTYPWGTLEAVYEAKDADLTCTATLRNTSGQVLDGFRANVLQLNDRLVFRPGGDPYGNGINMQWSHYFEFNAGARDGYNHMTQQAPHVYWWVDYAPPFDKQSVKVMFADLTGTWDTGVNRIKTDAGDRWPVFVAGTSWEMPPAGQVQERMVRVAIRFRKQDASLRPEVDRLYMRVKQLEAEQAKPAPKTAGPRLDDERLLDPDWEKKQAELDLDQPPAAAAEKQPVLSPAELAERLRAERAAAEKAFEAAYAQSLPSAIEVCADGYEAWGRYNTREMTWTDRRPIGAFFGCPDAATSPKNPNGWLKDPDGIDTTTPEGRQAFAKRLLEYVDRSIVVLEQAGAQGVIWWDLEGHRYPQPHITWVGDPRVLNPEHPHYRAFAPELNTPVEYRGETMPVVDACFRKWKDAGLKTGLTVRPQVMTYWPAVPLDQAEARLAAAQRRVDAARRALHEARESIDELIEDGRHSEPAEQELKQAEAALGKAQAEFEQASRGALPKEQVYENGGKETLPKAKYARDRWGCTLFYVDSISGVFGYWSMDAAARQLQDCLFLPEWGLARSYRCSAQLSVTGLTGYRRGVPAEILAAWPEAFCGMFHLDYGGIAAGRNEAAREDLEIAVARGNLPVFDCFYDNVDAVKVISDVYAKTGVKHAPVAGDQNVSAAADQPVAITLAASDEDGDPLAFAILGPPAHGSLSAFDEKTGRVTYTPARGWQGTDRFTFKAVDATGPSSNRGTVTVTVE
jgi:hypothetical protein